MGNRYAEDIIRIVGIDKNQNSLSAADVRQAILAKRGIGFINPVTKGGEGSTGTPGETQLPTGAGDGYGGADQGPANGNGGSTFGYGDTQAGANESGEFGLSPDDIQNGVTVGSSSYRTPTQIIDGTVPESKISQAQITTDGNEYINNYALAGMNSLQDCASDTDLQLHFRNEFVPPTDTALDENGDPVSISWADPDTPPEDPSFVEGEWWNCVMAQIQFLWTDGGGAEGFEATSLMDAVNIALDVLNVQRTSAQGGPHVWSIDHVEDDAFMDPDSKDIHLTYEGTENTYIVDVKKFDCTTNPPSDPGGICPTTTDVTVPEDGNWPLDGTTDLYLDTGQFGIHEKDTDAIAKYQNPASKIDFCFESGGRDGTVEVTKDNGFMIYETSTGAPTGIIRVYDSSGQMVAAGDTASGILDVNRP